MDFNGLLTKFIKTCYAIIIGLLTLFIVVAFIGSFVVFFF